MSPEDAINYVLEYSKGKVDQIDGLYSTSESLSLELFERKVQKSEASTSLGLGVRVLVNQCPGYSYSRKLSRDSLKTMIDDAVSLAQLTDPLTIDMPDQIELTQIDLKKYNTELESLSLAQMKEYCLDADELMQSLDDRVQIIEHLGAEKSQSESICFNHKGLINRVKANSVSSYIGVVCTEKESKKTGLAVESGRSWEEFDCKKLTERALLKATRLLGAKPYKSNAQYILLTNEISASLLGQFMSTFSADMVQKGQSKLKGKLKTKIANSIISLKSLPHIVGAPGSRMLDSEGVPTKDTDLIKNGVLMNYIYNLETSYKDKALPSGHASRGLSGKVGVSFNNLYMGKGSHSSTELIKDLNECFVIHKLEGGSACSAISGDISIGVQGCMYRNGEFDYAVEACTMSINYFDLLHQIVAISSEYNDQFTSVKFPDILVEGVTLSS